MKIFGNKKRIFGILFIVLIFSNLILIVTGFSEKEAYKVVYKIVYLEIYAALSFITFWISKSWLCNLTLSWIYYTISALGPLFISEQYFQVYNPFVVFLLTYALMLLGYYIVGISSHKLAFPRLKYIKATRIRLSWKTILYALFCFSTLLCCIYVFKNRALLFGGALEDGRVSAMAGNGVLLYGIQLYILTIPLMFMMFLQKKITWYVFFPLTIIAGGGMLMLGYRTPAFVMLILLLIIAVRVDLINLRKSINLAIVLFVFAMIFEVFRSGQAVDSMFSAVLDRFSARFGVSAVNTSYVFSTFPARVPFQHGYSNVIDLIMLLPGPGDDFSMWLKKMVGISFSGGGLAAPIQCSFYIDFGYPGMFIGMFFLGVFKRYIDDWSYSRGEINFWQIYLPYAFIMSGGCITDAFILPGVFFIVYYFIMIFANHELRIPLKEKR